MGLFFCMTKKARQKLKYLENENTFQGEKKYFSSVLKGKIKQIKMKQIKQILEGESPTLSKAVVFTNRFV